MKIAIVILNWNGKKLLEQFLPSVVKYSQEAKIYVADNASTDESISFLTDNFKKVVIIQNKTNGGFAKGYNDALKNLNEDLLILLNNDIEVTQNWLQPIINEFNHDSSLVAAQPKILDFKNKNYFEYAGAGGGFIDQFGYPFCRGRIFNSIERDKGQYNDIKKIFWATGACLIIKNNEFKKLNGFDEKFFAHQEEIDLCWRIQNLGYHVKYHYKSRVYHLNAGTLKASDSNKTYYNFRNQLYTLTKNCKENLFLLLFFKFFIDLLLSVFFLLTKGIKHTLAIYRAYISFYRKLQELMMLRKNLNREIVHYNVYSIIFYFLGLKRLKKV